MRWWKYSGKTLPGSCSFHTGVESYILSSRYLPIYYQATTTHLKTGQVMGIFGIKTILSAMKMKCKRITLHSDQEYGGVWSMHYNILQYSWAQLCNIAPSSWTILGFWMESSCRSLLKPTNFAGDDLHSILKWLFSDNQLTVMVIRNCELSYVISYGLFFTIFGTLLNNLCCHYFNFLLFCMNHKTVTKDNVQFLPENVVQLFLLIITHIRIAMLLFFSVFYHFSPGGFSILLKPQKILHSCYHRKGGAPLDWKIRFWRVKSVLCCFRVNAHWFRLELFSHTFSPSGLSLGISHHP